MSTGWLYWENDSAITALEKTLKDGDIVLGDSDTVFGLFGACTQKGFDSLNLIKRRSGKPYLILIDSVDKLDHFVQEPLSAQIKALIAAYWPGPLTIIFKAKKNVPSFLQSQAGTIAIRMPDHAGLLQLLSRFDDGLFSTSANLTHQPVPNKIEEIDPTIMHAVTQVVTNKSKVPDQGLPSTIIDCSGPDIKIIRAGALPLLQLHPTGFDSSRR